MTTWNYCDRRGQVRETDSGLLVADIPLRPNADALGTMAAAAPELLDALEALELTTSEAVAELCDLDIGNYYILKSTLEKARAAIAKARGEAQV